jgi:hypothetical protein
VLHVSSFTEELEGPARLSDLATSVDTAEGILSLMSAIADSSSETTISKARIRVAEGVVSTKSGPRSVLHAVVPLVDTDPGALLCDGNLKAGFRVRARGTYTIKATRRAPIPAPCYDACQVRGTNASACL